MKNKILTTCFAAGILLSGGRCLGNNLVVGTPTVAGAVISFSISWENSWYAPSQPSNWDAAWVFIKYKDCTTTNWLHASLSTAGNSVTGGVLQVENPAFADGKGVFIRRIATGGPGTIATATVSLTMTTPATGSWDFKVMGIEMVNCLAGDFEVGDGYSDWRFNSVTITSAYQSGGITSAVLGGNGTVNLPAAYPMGYNSFYAMKYEITQQQYVEFLNTLTYSQQALRTIVSPANSPYAYAMMGVGANDNGIQIMASGVSTTTPAVYGCNYNNNSGPTAFNEACDGQNKACNGLDWGNLAAYLDWAALRPMTELEFEKICRGGTPVTRVAGEFPWGNTQILGAETGYTQNVGCDNELGKSGVVGNGLCNCYRTWSGVRPIRVGFAATATTNRVTAGAAYYGAMDMAGNLHEIIVNTTTNGATYTGVLGDGDVSAVPAGWPSVSTASGMGLKGGYFSSSCDAASNSQLRTSNRNGYNTAPTAKDGTYGGRGVR